jgi:hypothetical protein
MWKVDERQNLWDLVDQLKEMHEVTLDAQQARDVALADGPDGDAKADAYLKTKAGKKKIRFDTTVFYAKDVHKAWAEGNAVQKMLAPMFHAEVEGQATFVAQAVRYDGREEARANRRRPSSSSSLRSSVRASERSLYYFSLRSSEQATPPFQL